MKKRLPVRLYNLVQRGLMGLGRRPGPFRDQEQELLDQAREATGLSDFGSAHFLTGLRVLLEAYDKQARLSPFGRMMVRGELAGILRSRLEVQAGLARQPELARAELRRPIFILGLPRTGTTALHQLLAQDPDNQVLEYWLAAAPRPRPPRSEWAREPRFKEAERALRPTYYLDPSLKAIHMMSADGPEECRHLLQESFLDDTFDSNATIPSYTEWYHAQDMVPAYEHHRDVLRLIESSLPGRRWVLKYPAHMRHLRALLQVYPDARFVWTHRDPARVLPSLCSLVSGWRGLYEDGVDREAIGRWQLDMWSTIMNDAIELRDALPSEQFFDLPFRDVVADPAGAIARMYAHFGCESGAEGEARIRAWRGANPQGKHGLHRYSPEDYGLTREQMAERFAPYVERFGVPAE